MATTYNYTHGMGHLVWTRDGILMNGRPKNDIPSSGSAKAWSGPHGDSDGRPRALHSEGSKQDYPNGAGPQQEAGSSGKPEEANGQAGLENDWRHRAYNSGIDWSHHNQGNQDPPPRDSLISREGVLIGLCMVAALIWGALIGQVLS